MNRSLMTASFLLYSLFVTSLAHGSYAYPQSAQVEALPTERQLAIVDTSEEKRQKALETLQRHPHLMSTLQRNQKALQPSLAVAPTAQKGSMNVQGLIDFLKKEEEKYPNRPLMVSVNVNNQSLYSNSNTIRPLITPPTNDPPDTKISFIQQGIAWAQTHKGLCFLYYLIGCYGALQLYLISIRRYLNKEGTWSRWKPHLTLEELYQITTFTLIKDILRTKKYAEGAGNCLASAVLLQEAVQEIKNELSTFIAYKSFVLGLQQLPLHRFLFWKRSSLHEEICNRIERLLYLKNKLISFLEEHQKTIPEKPVPQTALAL